MPCYVTGSAEGDARLAASEARERATEAARVACEVLQWLEDADIHLGSSFSKETRLWWERHKAFDAERKQKEIAERSRAEHRRIGLSKLTDEERKALGL